MRRSSKILLISLIFGSISCAAPSQSSQGIEPSHNTDDQTKARDGALAVIDPSDAGESVDTIHVHDAGIATPAYAFDDGNDDDDAPEDLPTAPLASRVKFTRVGTPPLALTRICDLTSFDGSLYAAHANQPLGTDGATITKYKIDDEGQANADGGAPKGKFSVAFDWNRPGEPTKGGGAGQGFLRVHKFHGRLFVSDADPPYNGLAMVEYGTEGYVFVSDEHGKFAPARMPDHKPPFAPNAEGKAGAGVLPRAYHVIDVARWDDAYFASTGSVPPTEKAWNGPSPGALHRANADLSRWIYDVDYPFPYQNGVWRLTFMTRFRGRLFAGIQDYDGREPNDYVYIASKEDARETPSVPREGGADLPQNRGRMHSARVTQFGAAETLRWYVDKKEHRLYWIEWSRDGVFLRATDNGDDWRAIDLPSDAGRPTDIKRFGDSLVVLTERAIYSFDGDKTFKELGRVADKKTPFELSDFFCAAPLGIYKGALYVGGQRGGTLYRVDADD